MDFRDDRSFLAMVDDAGDKLGNDYIAIPSGEHDVVAVRNKRD